MCLRHSYSVFSVFNSGFDLVSMFSTLKKKVKFTSKLFRAMWTKLVLGVYHNHSFGWLCTLIHNYANWFSMFNVRVVHLRMFLYITCHIWFMNNLFFPVCVTTFFLRDFLVILLGIFPEGNCEVLTFTGQLECVLLLTVNASSNNLYVLASSNSFMCDNVDNNVSSYWVSTHFPT